MSSLIIMFSCSSDSEPIEDDISDDFRITQITPNTGFSGDEVTIKWEGFSENIAQYSVKFNGVSSEIVNTTNTQLTCIVPQNASTGIISLKLNEVEILSSENFTVQEITSASFSITGTSPNLLKPGYEMIFSGTGFGDEIANASIKFTTNDSQMVTAKILNLTDAEMEVAIPVNAVTGEVEITINGETVVTTVTLNQVLHKPIYYYYSSRIRSFKMGNNGELESRNESGGFSGDVYEIHSFGYDSSDNIFFGNSTYNSGVSDVLKFIGFNDTSNNEYTNSLCSQSSGCPNANSSVVNSITNKKYSILYNYNGTYSINEIDIFGETITNEATLTFDQYVAARFIFIPEMNSFISIRDNGNNFRIVKINATTFQYESYTIGDGVLQFSGQNELGELIYDANENRLFYPRMNNIYEIDLTNNTVENLNTDWYDFMDNNVAAATDSSYRPVNCIYYAPTNDIYIQAYAAFTTTSQNKIFAVNLASKETRELETAPGFSYSGNNGGSRIFDWVMKPN